MAVPKINSAHGSDTRNVINAAIDAINFQGKTIQDLVAEGQLTPTQYATLIQTINGMVKSGHVDKSDLTPEFKGEIEGFNTQLAHTASKEEVEIERQRISSLTANAGDTDGNAELLDIRVGFDGKEYTTAGDATRSAGTYALKVRNDIIDESMNLFNKGSDDILDGQFVNRHNEIFTGTNYMMSGKIKVHPSETFAINEQPPYPDNQYGGYYTADGKWIDRIETTSLNGVNVFTVPDYENVDHVRLNMDKRIIDDIMVVKSNTLPTNYIPFYPTRIKEGIRLNELQKEEVTSMMSGGGNTGSFVQNPLHQKIATFNGDSICKGDAMPNGDGWARAIGEKNDMTWENRAVNGATISAETYTPGGSPRHWVTRDVDNMRADADYIILQGGVNDRSSTQLGEITPDYTSVLDDTTWCGALENLFKKSITKYHGKKIGFIITFKAYSLSTQEDMNGRWELAREICEKWSIPYLDLWKEGGLSPNVEILDQTYFTNGDKVHPNQAGYEKYLIPKIEAWMRTL